MIKGYNLTQTGPQVQQILNNSGKSLSATISLTYAELKALRDSGKMVPGQYYRIIDYVTVMSESIVEPISGQTLYTHMKSAGHPFDIIVMATSESEISQNASAMHHEGDEYFANSELGAWQIRYRFSDPNKHFEDIYLPEDNKGVIYWMRDEFGNECGYDFKNILFERYKLIDYDTPKIYLDREQDAEFLALQSFIGSMNGNMQIFTSASDYISYGGYISEAELAASGLDYLDSQTGDAVTFSPTGTRMFVKMNDHGDYLKEVNPQPVWLYTFQSLQLYNGDASMNSAGPLDAVCVDNVVNGSFTIVFDNSFRNKIGCSNSSIVACQDCQVDGNRIAIIADHFNSDEIVDSAITLAGKSEIKHADHFYSRDVSTAIIANLQGKYKFRIVDYIGVDGE